MPASSTLEPTDVPGVTTPDVPRSAAVHRRRGPATWMWFCAVGLLGVITSVAADDPTVRIVILVIAAVLSSATVVIVTIRRRPENPTTWFLLAGGCVVLAGATAIGSSLRPSDIDDAASVFLGVQLGGYALLFAGFIGAARLRRGVRDLDSALDAMILGLAFGLFAWRSVFSDAVNDAQVGAVKIFVVSLLPALDIVTCTALLRRAFSALRTSTAFRLIMLATGAATGAHLVSGVSILREAALAHHVPFQVALFTLIAAAALHPSMRAVTEPDEPATRSFGATRIALLALALLDPPIVMLMDYDHPNRTSTALLIGAVGMSIIVIIRLITLAREMERTRERERLREQRFESLVQNSTDLIVLLDDAFRITYLSPAVNDLLGFRPSDVLGRGAVEAFHPDDLEHTDRALHDLVPGATSDLNLVRLRHRTDGWRWVEAKAVNLSDDPTVGGIVINCRDVTERIAAESLLSDTNTQQRAIARLGQSALSAPDIRSLTTSAASLVRSTLNVKSCTVLHLEGDVIEDIVVARAESTGVVPLIGDPDARILAACRAATEPIQFVDPDPEGDLRTIRDLTFTSFADTQIRSGQTQSTDSFSHVMAMQLGDRDRIVGALLVRSGAPRTFTRSEAGFLSTMAGTLGLALARRRTEASAKHSALHDELTDLPNRSLFVDRLDQALAQRGRTGDQLAVLFLDIDHFKVINDSLGHSAGDDILRSVARRLAALVRPSDTVARFGGDEFTVLLHPLADSDEAEQIAERIRADISRPVSAETPSVQPTISIGIAMAPSTGSDAESLLRDADAAMYQAKEQGRNNVAFFDDTMRDRVIHRLRTEVDLPHAITTGQLEMHYQPIVELSTGRTCGLEALVRWRHPTLGLLPPDQFIPVAEQSGLIGELDLWVMHRVMAQCARTHDALGDAAPWFALNISVRTVASPDLPFLVAQTLAETGAPADRICLEITESALMHDIERSIRMLTSVRDHGVALAVDDFGTGYSSLTYLKRLPVTDLKIDASFIAGIDAAGPDRAIVDAVVTLASTLGQTAIAEGVETPAQLEALKALGCPLAQGYLLGRPAPIDEIRLDIASPVSDPAGNAPAAQASRTSADG